MDWEEAELGGLQTVVSMRNATFSAANTRFKEVVENSLPQGNMLFLKPIQRQSRVVRSVGPCESAPLAPSLALSRSHF